MPSLYAVLYRTRMETAANHRSSEEARTHHVNRPLEIAVVFTDVQATLEGLRVAEPLTRDITAKINLLVPDAGNHSASTINPVVLADFTCRYFLAMFPHSTKLEIKITLYPVSTADLWEVLPPSSIIIVAGTANRLWPSAEQRFARQLRDAGHEVIFVLAPR